MKRLLLLIACTCAISIHAMESELETPSREDLPAVESPMSITTKYQNLIHTRNWERIVSIVFYENMPSGDETAIIKGMARAQQIFDEACLKDVIKHPSKYNNPVTALQNTKILHEASTVTFDLISSIFASQKGNN